MTDTEPAEKNNPNTMSASASDSTSNDRSAHGSDSVRLDRSRARLRLPEDLARQVLRLAHLEAMPGGDQVDPAKELDSATVFLLEEAGILVNGTLDPVARQVLDVVNQASLKLSVAMSYGDDESDSTVWATPRRAVMSSPFDADFVHYQSVPVAQLPQVIGQLIVLQSPRYVGDVFLEIDRRLLNRIKQLEAEVDEAVDLLMEAGLDKDQALLLIDLQRDDLRRWHIDSTWSTENGPMVAELAGIDGEQSGLWLVGDPEPQEGEPPTAPNQRVLYNPQGHGEVTRALRKVLPKNWLGTPLDPLPTFAS